MGIQENYDGVSQINLCGVVPNLELSVINAFLRLLVFVNMHVTKLVREIEVFDFYNSIVGVSPIAGRIRSLNARRSDCGLRAFPWRTSVGRRVSFERARRMAATAIAVKPGVLPSSTGRCQMS